MAEKNTININYILDNLMNDPAVSAAVKKLQDTITELSMAVTQKITYDVIQNTALKIQKKIKTQTKKPQVHKPITNWSNATEIQLRAARLNRRRNGRPLEPDLVAELQARFPNYDAPSDTFTHTKRTRTKEYWIKKSDAALYSALRERRTRGHDIEPELSAALSERFTTFNPETKSIKRRSTKHTNWANTTEKQLKVARLNRRRDGQPLEPDLIAELQARFPNYDAQTDTFIITEIDWSKQSKKSLQTAINYRKRTGQIIPTEMTVALEQKRTDNRRKTRTDWSNASNQNLRMAYYYRITRKLQIEPSLNAALAAAFPGYDATTQTFTGKHHHTTHTKDITQKTNTETSKTVERLLPLYSVPTINGNYALHFNNGKTDKTLLKAASQPFEVCLINKKSHLAIIRKIYNTKKFALYVINYKKGELIQQTKPGVAIISYSPTTHELYTKQHRDIPSQVHCIHPDTAVSRPLMLPSELPKIMAAQIKKETILIEENGNVSAHPLLTLGNYDENDAQNETINQILTLAHERIIKFEQKQVQITKTEIKQPEPQDKAPVTATPKKTIEEPDQQRKITTIPVYIEHVKSNLMGAYNNVYLNGKKILSNHFDTKIKLLLNDTLLGIHGIVTDNPDLPQTPIWMIYDTCMQSRIGKHMQKFSGYQVYAKNIIETNDGLRMDLSNRCTTILKRDRITKLAANKRFTIATEKTK